MNHNVWRMVACAALALAACQIFAGCASLPERKKKVDPAEARRAEEARRTAEMRAIHDEIQQLQEQIDLLKQTNEVLGQELEKIQRQLREQERFQTQLDELQRKIQALGKAREQDRDAIVEDISRKVSSMLEAGRAAAQAEKNRETGSDVGYEHVVQRGQTLSEIAKAYGVSQAVILKANRLKSANSIRVGQKLFIPEK